MDIHWDPQKAITNHRKHGIHFREVEPVFYDPHAIVTEDLGSIDEQRLVVIGLDTRQRVVTVVYCLRSQAVRVISARKATRSERSSYEKRI